MTPGGPGWQPRLVALDIDGTLLRWIEDDDGEAVGAAHEEVNPAVREAVRAAQDAGAHVVLASGRSPEGMMPVADLLGITDGRSGTPQGPLWVVASNGAVVFRYPPFELVEETTFDASESVRAVLAEHPEAMVAVEERRVGYKVSRPFPPGELTGQLVEAPIDEIVGEPVSRVIIRDPNASVDDFVATAKRVGLQGTEYFVGWTAWLDLQPPGVSKASGLALVCDDLGLDAADVLAIGDGRNDLEMLRWAGRGVAMGQAPDVVHEAADASTDSVDDDGAAREIRRWFP